MQSNKIMTSSGDTEATRLAEEPDPRDQTTNHPLDLPYNHSEDLHLGVKIPSAEGSKATIIKGTNSATTRFIFPEAQSNGKMSHSFPSTLEIESADITHGTSQNHEGHSRARLHPRRGSTIPRPSHWGGRDQEPTHGPDCKKTLVLCFDGTGNKFKGNSGDTNILKIFSMLDRRKGDQYHYYQPGIGTYLTSHGMMHRTSQKGISGRFTSAYQKAVDAAVGKSFDQHVMGGYRFLMRYYHPGDDIYMFGFSRGAYTARFLCEMLDHVGLVVQGNEEMVLFAWKTFSAWQMRAHDDSTQGKRKKEEMYNYMKAFRETFARPVKRVRFLGLFDTVNSVPRFENAWLKRESRFPYTARSTARVIRHAVGLDERRAKFRQDLVEKVDLQEIQERIQGSAERIDEDIPNRQNKKKKRSWDEKQPQAVKDGLVMGPIRTLSGKAGGIQPPSKGNPNPSLLRMAMSGDEINSQNGPGVSSLSLNIHFDREDGDEEDVEQDVEELWFPGAHGDIGGGWDLAPGEPNLAYGPLVWMVREARRAGLIFDEKRLRELGCYTDLDAIHDNEHDENSDHNPIIELVKATPESSPIRDEVNEKPILSDSEIEKARDTNGSTYAACLGDEEEVYAIKLPPQNTPMEMDESRNPFDTVFANLKLKKTRSGAKSEYSGSSARSSSRNIDNESQSAVKPQPLTTPRVQRRPEIDYQTEACLRGSYANSKIHCCLTFGGGLPHTSTLGWKVMEYLPFRRMDLQQDGSWKAILWPLPRGEVRDVPDDAKIHCSVLKRMQADPKYRPGNLLVGGGGRGVRVAPPEYGTGEWVVLREEGSMVGEVLVKKSSFRPKIVTP